MLIHIYWNKNDGTPAVGVSKHELVFFFFYKLRFICSDVKKVVLEKIYFKSVKKNRDIPIFVKKIAYHDTVKGKCQPVSTKIAKSWNVKTSWELAQQNKLQNDGVSQ